MPSHEVGWKSTRHASHSFQSCRTSWGHTADVYLLNICRNSSIDFLSFSMIPPSSPSSSSSCRGPGSPLALVQLPALLCTFFPFACNDTTAKGINQSHTSKKTTWHTCSPMMTFTCTVAFFFAWILSVPHLPDIFSSPPLNPN
jgi:hypothetical protein